MIACLNASWLAEDALVALSLYHLLRLYLAQMVVPVRRLYRYLSTVKQSAFRGSAPHERLASALRAPCEVPCASCQVDMRPTSIKMHAFRLRVMGHLVYKGSFCGSGKFAGSVISNDQCRSCRTPTT